MTVFAGDRRIAASATCLSWIPPRAVEGAFKLPFSLGVAHYDVPPPHSAPDVDGLLAADAIRFANRLRAWIDVTDGHITGYGMDGGGRLGNTTVRLASRTVTFAGVALPDLTGARGITSPAPPQGLVAWSDRRNQARYRIRALLTVSLPVASYR